MCSAPYTAVYEVTRGEVVESIHYGSAAVVDATGKLVAWYGDPQAITYLRSSAKPFQVLPFLLAGGEQHYGLSEREIALICASHSGTDQHQSAVQGIQAKTGVSEGELLCGVHPPYDAQTQEAMRQRGESPTPNRHNCSGKHTGMLAFAKLLGAPSGDYIDLDHPVQRRILDIFAEMCGLSPGQVQIGIDGCSAPNFAVPLYHAAHAYARLCDPDGGGLPAYAAACRRITGAMLSHPDMVGGPGRFDTRLMEASGGMLVVKGGAEGYQGIGLMAGALGPGSPALGVALKISDGDLKTRARPAVALEILRQLGAVTPTALAALAEFGPCLPVANWRKRTVGEAHPCFTLHRAQES